MQFWKNICVVFQFFPFFISIRAICFKIYINRNWETNLLKAQSNYSYFKKNINYVFFTNLGYTPSETRKFPTYQNYQIFTLKTLYRLKDIVKLYQTCNVASWFISKHVCQVWSLYRQTGNREAKFGNSAILEKPFTLKNPTPPTVFAAHPSNYAQILTTKLQRASRSRIFEFAFQFF